MTYRRFHYYFNLPLLFLLGILAYPSWSLHDTVVAIGLCLIVVLFTTPWDNWAVKRNLWNFPQDRILFRIWYCPIEEYFFFLTQTIQACLLTDILRRWFVKEISHEPNYLSAGILASLWIILFFIFQKIPRARSLTYFWHILFWMLPVIGFQWTMGGIFIQQPILVIVTTLLLGTLLSLFDLIAIRKGIWFFDETQTLRFKLFRLIPIEEVIFFYLTTLMVVQGFLLFT